MLDKGNYEIELNQILYLKSNLSSDSFAEALFWLCDEENEQEDLSLSIHRGSFKEALEILSDLYWKISQDFNLKQLIIEIHHKSFDMLAESPLNSSSSMHFDYDSLHSYRKGNSSSFEEEKKIENYSINSPSIKIKKERDLYNFNIKDYQLSNSNNSISFELESMKIQLYDDLNFNEIYDKNDKPLPNSIDKFISKKQTTTFQHDLEVKQEEQDDGKCKCVVM